MNITEKTSAVGGLSKEELLAWLNESPKTSGWDAIVVYNRGRANALLMQQYIRNLTADNYLSPIDGKIEGAEGSKLDFYGIQLGLPRLTFENADIENSKARVTQTITAGLAILTSEPVGGYKGIHSIMRPNGAVGPTLWMDVELKNAPGGVDSAGEVTLDLKEMKGFDTDLFSDPVSTANARVFFQERFEEQPELQVYHLGKLGTAADSTLTPATFKVQTQAAPGAKTRGAPNYGDGAVVLFVTLKGGTNGGIPTEGSDFKYLIPNDENGTKYSSAVLLSNRTLFTTLLHPKLSGDLPDTTLKLVSSLDPEGNPRHLELEISSGTIARTDYRYSATNGANLCTATCALMEFPLTGATFSAKDNTIHLAWNDEKTIIIHKNVVRPGLSDIDEDIPVTFFISADSSTEIKVDPESSLITFNQMKTISELVTTDVDNYHWYGETNGHNFILTLISIFEASFFRFIETLKLPDIDTFLLRNLLFPDLNSMVITEAYVPGDLAIFGNVDPSLSSFVITPQAPVMVTGAALKFTTDPIVAGVQWSVKGLPGGTGPIGSFSTNGDGTYTAPSRDEMAGRETQQVIVTATGTTRRNTQASSSAVVSIVSRPISVNPLFRVASPGTSFELTAGTTDERTLNWALKDPGQGGGLSPATGKTSTYTAPPASATAMFTLEVIQVTDDQGNMGQADILVINKALGGQVKVDLASADPGQAQLQFEVMYDDGPIIIPPEFLTWTLLAGTGSVDAQGTYTEPQQQEPGFALLTCAFKLENPPLPPRTDYGYTVLPLPLGAYPDMIRSYR